MADFIYPSWSWIKTSEYPPNFLPAGSIVIDQTSEDGDCTVKGFYDPKTGEYHIQEVVHNDRVERPGAASGDRSARTTGCAANGTNDERTEK